jgi:putative addiction module component (TIGR02574 family)
MKVTAIEQTVLSLSKSDRAHLVNVLLDSLDEPSKLDIQQRWLETSQRRASEIDLGKVKLVSGEELEAQVQAVLR